eukprot:g33322.t1
MMPVPPSLCRHFAAVGTRPKQQQSLQSSGAIYCLWAYLTNIVFDEVAAADSRSCVCSGKPVIQYQYKKSSHTKSKNTTIKNTGDRSTKLRFVTTLGNIIRDNK